MKPGVKPGVNLSPRETETMPCLAMPAVALALLLAASGGHAQAVPDEGPAPAGSCVFFSGQGRGRGQAPAQPRVMPAPREGSGCRRPPSAAGPTARRALAP